MPCGAFRTGTTTSAILTEFRLHGTTAFMRRMEISRALETARRDAQAGQFRQAETTYQEILQADPVHIDAINQLAVLYHKAGRAADACNLFARAIQINPQVAAFHANYAVALWLLDRFDEAIAAARRAVDLNAHDHASWQTLGDMLQQRGDLPGAAETLKHSIQLQENPVIYGKLLNILMTLGRVKEALPIAHRAVELEPNRANAYRNLAIVLTAADQLDVAEQAYRKALALKPGDGMIYAGLGGISIRRKDYAAALDCFRQSARLESQDPRPKNNLGTLLLTCGYIDESIGWLKAAINSSQPIYEAFESLLLAMQYADKIDAQIVLESHKRWYQLYGAPLAALAQPHANSPDPNRRLRIGYISPDFCHHSVGRFIEPVLASHDHAQFEVFCYSAVKQPDDATSRMSAQADHWRPVTQMTHQQIARLVREDQIDLLVDLSGHTEDSRLLAFASKPAPAQITYLGYPNTTGLPQMDYRLTDSIADPPGTTEHLHTEELIRLPETAWCYRAPDDAPDVAPLPAKTNGYITFGSFNNISKLSDRTIALWAQLLNAVRDSRLLIKARIMPEPGMDRLRKKFAERGITGQRLELLSTAPTTEEHLRLYERVDIGLDPFPYNGTTTTCEALYLGVPVITLSGQVHASRVGSSLLTTVGFPGWIASSDEQFVQIGSSLMRDLDQLAALRHSLRDRLRQSPLMDAPRFTCNLESIYRTVWRRWCEARERDPGT